MCNIFIRISKVVHRQTPFRCDCGQTNLGFHLTCLSPRGYDPSRHRERPLLWVERLKEDGVARRYFNLTTNILPCTGTFSICRGATARQCPADPALRPTSVRMGRWGWGPDTEGRLGASSSFPLLL